MFQMARYLNGMFGIQMASLCDMLYVLDQPFEYLTSTCENKMASIAWYSNGWAVRY